MIKKEYLRNFKDLEKIVFHLTKAADSIGFYFNLPSRWKVHSWFTPGFAFGVKILFFFFGCEILRIFHVFSIRFWSRATWVVDVSSQPMTFYCNHFSCHEILEFSLECFNWRDCKIEVMCGVKVRFYHGGEKGRLRSREIVNTSTVWEKTVAVDDWEKVFEDSPGCLVHLRRKKTTNDPKTVPIVKLSESATGNYERIFNVNNGTQFRMFLQIKILKSS